MSPRAAPFRILALCVFIGLPAVTYAVSLHPGRHVSTGFPRRSPSTSTPAPLRVVTLPAELSRAQFAVVEGRLTSIVYRENPRAALAELSRLMDGNPAVLRSCHALAHAIGHAGYAKYRDFATAVQYQDDICGSGYLHGVVEARFAHVTDVYAELQTICSSYIAVNQAGKCFHGVGHGLMRFTGNDVPRSLALCSTYTLDVYKVRCSEGIFMENFGTDLSVHTSRFLRPKEPLYPCAEQPEFYKGSCYYYAPLFYLNLHDGRYADALRLCDQAESAYVDMCVTGTGSRIMKQNIQRPRWVERLCRQAGSSKTAACIAGMVSYYLVNFNSYRRGQALCGRMEADDKPDCYRALQARQSIFPP